jgi:hypothetical protein
MLTSRGLLATAIILNGVRMMTTFHIPHKELRPSLKRYADGDTSPAWDLYLDGALVASEIVSPIEAQLELDQIAYCALFGDTPLAPELPITDEALGLALAVFNRLFSVEKVQEKGRLARDKIIAAGMYTITSTGDLSVMASTGRGSVAYAVTTAAAEEDTRYTVTMACECRDFFARAHEHGGICKHVAARLLLSLAQRGVGLLKHLRDALDTASSTIHVTQQTSPTETPLSAPEETAALAFVEIDATDLLAALRLGRRGGAPVTIRAAQGTLELRAGVTQLVIPGLEGAACAATQLDQEAFSSLYEQLRPVAKTAGVLALFIEDDGTLILGGRTETHFSIIVQGMPIAETPAIPQAADVLHELFLLLEQYEPEWYLRRHERIAREALERTGRLAA